MHIPTHTKVISQLLKKLCSPTFFPSSHCHFYTTLQSLDVVPRIPWKVSFYFTHTIYEERWGTTLGSILTSGSFMHFPHTFHWILYHLYILFWKVYHNCTVYTSVWITEFMVQSRSLKFFCRMIFHQVLFAFSVSALQRGKYRDLQDPIARRILKIFVLLTFHSVHTTKIYSQLYTFIRHEIHWVQNLHRFQLMKKLQQLSVCWLRVGLS